MTTPNVSQPDAGVKNLSDEQQPFYLDTDLCRRWRCSKPTLWRRRREDPRCPRPIKGFGQRNLTPLDEILAYEAILLAERDGLTAIAAAARKREARKREARSLK